MFEPQTFVSDWLQIVAFERHHAAEFYALNRVWLDRYDLFEAGDEKQLSDPWGAILDPGGAIFVALENRDVVGTVALVPRGPGHMEIAKLSVADRCQGKGLGRRLVRHALEHARRFGATRVSLTSNSRLVAAIQLYESFGFTHDRPPAVPEYKTADTYMSLDLTRPVRESRRGARDQGTG